MLEQGLSMSWCLRRDGLETGLIIGLCARRILMKKFRRMHREDSAAEYPSPEEIAKWSPECGLSLAELGGIKENVHATDVGCWTFSLNSSIGFVRDGLLNLLELGWRGLALLTIIFIWVAAITYANNDVTRYFDRWFSAQYVLSIKYKPWWKNDSVELVQCTVLWIPCCLIKNF